MFGTLVTKFKDKVIAKRPKTKPKNRYFVSFCQNI